MVFLGKTGPEPKSLAEQSPDFWNILEVNTLPQNDLIPMRSLPSDPKTSDSKGVCEHLPKKNRLRQRDPPFYVIYFYDVCCCCDNVLRTLMPLPGMMIALKFHYQSFFICMQKKSAGGLVTAVAPVVIKGKGLWVGWPGLHLPKDFDDVNIPESDPSDQTPTAGLKSEQVRSHSSVISAEFYDHTITGGDRQL